MRYQIIAVSLLAFTLHSAGELNAQWAKTSCPNRGAINCFAMVGTIIFAGGDSGSIYRSSDEGAAWTEAHSGLSFHRSVLTLCGVVSQKSSHATLFAGTDSGVYFSRDSGAHWVLGGLDTLRISNLVTDRQYIYVYAAGKYYSDVGSVYRMLDQGQTWSLVCDTIHFGLAVTKGKLFAGSSGRNAAVYSSIDGGISWSLSDSEMSLELTAYPYDAYFVDHIAAQDSMVLAVTGHHHAALMISTNTGTNWFFHPLDNVAGDTHGMGNFVISPPFIFAIELSGAGLTMIVQSKDTGLSWNSIDDGLSNWDFGPSNGPQILFSSGKFLFTSIDSINDHLGVWRRPLSDFGKSSVPKKTNIENSFSSFPNPFSKSTTITLSNQDRAFAEISVINFLGILVTRLYSGVLDAGEYSFLWDARGIPSGIYICEVLMNGQILRSPMILMR